MIKRRGLLAAAAGIAASPARAQGGAAWQPRGPLEIIVGFAPGGGADLAARAIAQAAASRFPVPLVVINKAGAGGALAAQQVAGLPPDGQALLVGGGSESTSLPAFREVPYDPKRSFRAILRLTRQPLLVVAGKRGRFADLKAAVEAARAQPGTVSHASSGIGSLYHAVFLLLGKAAGVEFLHVPYTGGGPSLQALLAGTVELAVLAPEEMGGLAADGEVRPLAVASAGRLPAFPAVPTLRELGWNVEIENMKGLMGPAGMPDAVATSLHDRFRAAMSDPAWQTFLERTGATEGYLNGPAFQAAMDRLLDQVSAAVRQT
ncbi:tripartite tricarboxylate transporter substrate binding protein [Roseomonas sp. M0104]|uniref:Tripartite tricarboxylate transporter substrate binding protein n=1 Tax=Teichococcus coralli TaxID=2545983 RepID=A0A845BGZ4_9PROT|nr:tripartite tricarboxylate transporter substrate binding protein [Pseudoroseomonas coralli]MXP62739.1 tripartite tricarboxylate transporter substrate binding protein [Pseudoroseomonas coralli]